MDTGDRGFIRQMNGRRLKVKNKQTKGGTIKGGVNCEASGGEKGGRRWVEVEIAWDKGENGCAPRWGRGNRRQQKRWGCSLPKIGEFDFIQFLQYACVINRGDPEQRR